MLHNPSSSFSPTDTLASSVSLHISLFLARHLGRLGRFWMLIFEVCMGLSCSIPLLREIVPDLLVHVHLLTASVTRG
jgi:hypothetical protein